MTSRAHKRKDSIEEATVVPTAISKVFSMARSTARMPLSLLAAHRWKAAAAGVVGAVGLLAMTGVVDFSSFSSWVTQYASHRSDVTASTEPTVQPASELGLAVVSKPELATCFTPGQDCMGKIVSAIDGARAEILVQAYSYTAKPLIKALGRARLRGVKVRVILDQADERQRNSAGSRLIAQGVLPQVDTGVASAHNKVMIIDRDTVITGSFNFTEAAQQKNAENVLLIKGYPDIASAYAKNWEKRLAASRPYYGTMAPVL
jgi:phosphatidylserine/phosphatidylglycerophosphate/cardiolipin synthase-like enzyme